MRPFVCLETEKGGVVERNTKDLTWAEFSMVRIVVGRVLSLGAGPAVEPTTTLGIPNPIPVGVRLDLGPSEGERDGVVYLWIGSERCVRPEVLVGRQVLAVVNIESEAGEGE